MKEMLLALLLLIIGFVLLIKGADFFVDGSSSVAKRLKVPSMIIGLTIVAMGTSLPECAVSVTASLNNNNALAVSNVIGSNIFNLMVVCGVCALFTPLAVSKDTLKKEFPFSIICAILLAALGAVGMTLGRIDGIVFLVIFAVYLCLMIVSAKNARNEALNKELEEEVDEEIKILPVWQCIVSPIRFWLIPNPVAIVEAPSIVAAKKNEVDMALGNVIGSNIFNILLVLGVAGAISPVAFVTENLIDIAILVVMSVVVWIFAWSKKKLVNWHGAVMLVSYVAYLVYICIR